MRKSAAETKKFSNTWTLPTGVTISSQTWATSPSGPTFAGEAIASNVTSARIAGGTNGVDYTITNTVTLSDAQILQQVFTLRVRSAADALVAYTTLERAAKELDITTPDDLDRLADMLLEAKSMTDAFCNRTFEYQEDITERVRGYGDGFLIVQQTPITEITSITKAGSLIDASNYEIDDADAGIIYSSTGFAANDIVLEGLVNRVLPNSQEADIDIVYSGGYVLPGAAERNLPYDIERAQMQIIKHLWQSRTRDTSIKSEKADDIYQATYTEDAGSAMPMAAQLLLSRWKRTGGV